MILNCTNPKVNSHKSHIMFLILHNLQIYNLMEGFWFPFLSCGWFSCLFKCTRKMKINPKSSNSTIWVIVIDQKSFTFSLSCDWSENLMDCFFGPEIDLPGTQSLSDKYSVPMFYLLVYIHLTKPCQHFCFHFPAKAPSCLCLVQKSSSSSQNWSPEMPGFSSFLKISSLKGFPHSCLLPC